MANQQHIPYPQTKIKIENNWVMKNADQLRLDWVVSACILLASERDSNIFMRQFPRHSVDMQVKTRVWAE